MREMAIEYKPIRSIELSEMAAMGYLAQGDLSPLEEKVRKVAKECIKDGAEAVIIGCGLKTVLITTGIGLTEIDGVPFVDPFVASIKTIEYLVELNKCGMPFKSKRGLYWSK